MKRNILLNPGPATISMRVKKAQLVPDICPREQEFGDLMAKISAGLLGFVKDAKDSSCVLFGGSGTLAVESTLASALDKSHKLAIIVNGAYGQRMCEIAKYHGLNYVVFQSSFLEPIDFLELEQFLQKERPDFLSVVHSETTSGLLNDLTQISKIAHPLGIKIIADCMSSFACYEISLNEVDFIIASSNKNIQGTAGISFVIAKNQNIMHAEFAKSLYLDLKAQYEYFIKHHQMRFTPPVQVAYALYEAILELQEEGLKNRFLRYQKSNAILRQGLEDLGFCIYPKSSYSVIITSIDIPKNMNFEELHQFCKNRGFTIYPGKIAGKEMFRIANIGEIDSYDMQLFLQVLQEFCQHTIINQKN
ncbi:aminotransferase class V-fold PLP-dependent enzyme [Helicobacter sp. faydin-H20]|uniref:aminotransferase class V-fold PLP-dependent enzyme n=1 Tax=Helicobacter anatolicus TaxID=2905874 RepID=UPI001E44A2B4|nr:aminotransferase class V-fold PLP-dependent enzyme [Helicobacter anatolicus]MCE3036721.1 aminotransferase class V-fold PLP-dependent enzyme [Helicobacter anatolicus]